MTQEKASQKAAVNEEDDNDLILNSYEILNFQTLNSINWTIFSNVLYVGSIC